MPVIINGSTGISGVDGSTGTPAFQGTDTNTGIRFGTDIVSLVTGGSDRLYIDSSGRVGVGTSSPSAILDVKVASDAKLLVQDGNTTGNVKFNVVNNAVSANVNLEIAASNTQFFNGGSERARIDSSGRLLVGTTSSASAGDAQYALVQIQGNPTNSAGTGILALRRGEAATSITTGEAIGLIQFSDTTGNPFGYIQCEADSTAGSSDYPGRLVFATTSDGASSPTERFRIDSYTRIVMGGAVIYSAGGNAALNSSFSVDVQVRDDSGSGNGGAYKVFAGITHLNFSAYGAVYEAWVACRGTSVNESLVQNNTTSGQGGSWTVTKPSNTVLRVTHNAGSLGALGNYFILVFAAA
jgi:hypothetical protein